MATYSDIISRDTENDPLIPEEIVKILVEDMPQQSVLLSRARRVPMSRKKGRQPVLSALPQAYWVDGDTGLKQTSSADWKNVFITAEELAVIVPIPDTYFSDADIPLWDSIKGPIVEAIGAKVDGAGLFGTDAPASWPTAVIPAAIAAGNVVEEGDGVDFGQDVATMGELVANEGFDINGFASRPGLNWKLVGLRDAQDRPIYGAPMAEGQPHTLYGLPLNPVRNGSWESATAQLLGADWSKFVIGVREDVSFRVFSEGVISDDDGKVILNLMQQDAKALRVTFRVGFQVANPINRLVEDEADRYPAGIIATTGSLSA